MTFIVDLIAWCCAAFVLAAILDLRVYLGFPGWGWRMFGIGYKTKWFLGFSCALKSDPP